MYLSYRFFYNQWDAKLQRICQQLSAREGHYGLAATFCLIQQGKDIAYFLTDSNAIHDEFLLCMETEKLAPETIPLSTVGAVLRGDHAPLICHGSDYIRTQVKG